MVFDPARIWIKKVADHEDAVLEPATCCGEAALTRRLHGCIPYGLLPTPRTRSAHHLHMQRFSNSAVNRNAILCDATLVTQSTLEFLRSYQAPSLFLTGDQSFRRQQSAPRSRPISHSLTDILLNPELHRTSVSAPRKQVMPFPASRH